MPTPQILTSDKWAEWLPSDVQSADRLPTKVWRAERYLINRYREHEPGAEAVREDTKDAPVQIIDWEEDSDGNPDVSAMPDKLVTRLRDVISRIVTERHKAPDDKAESISQGSKSVTYRKDAGSLPRSVFRPLRPYDDRTPFSAGV